MATGIRRTGDFCWINMLTPNPAKAREFFAKLLDWTYVGDAGDRPSHPGRRSRYRRPVRPRESADAARERRR